MDKLVNGVLVQMTAEEVSARQLEELKNTPPTKYHTWDDVNKVWVEDMPNAKAIRMDEFRAMRESKYTEIAIEHLKAFDLDDSAKLNIIKVKRQALRDVPQVETWAGITNIAELAAYTPAILLEDFTQL